MDQLYDEVVRHHDHLADWLGGAAGPELLETFTAAHHPDFILVTIDGDRLDLAALTTGLEKAHSAVPGLQIGIEEFEVVLSTEQVAIVRFLERHSIGASRRSTAVLVPGGDRVRWLGVQETRVP